MKKVTWRHGGQSGKLGLRCRRRVTPAPRKEINVAGRGGVAVGTIITDRPPHRTVLAQFTHTVPPMDQRCAV